MSTIIFLSLCQRVVNGFILHFGKCIYTITLYDHFPSGLNKRCPGISMHITWPAVSCKTSCCTDGVIKRYVFMQVVRTLLSCHFVDTSLYTVVWQAASAAWTCFISYSEAWISCKSFRGELVQIDHQRIPSSIKQAPTHVLEDATLTLCTKTVQSASTFRAFWLEGLVVWGFCYDKIHSTKKPVTTMLTYPWKCTVLHCNHLGNTWKPLVLMTQHFDYCLSASEWNFSQSNFLG